MTNGRRYHSVGRLTMTFVDYGTSRGDAHHVRLRDSLPVVCAFDMSVTIPLSSVTNSSITVIKACANSNPSRYIQKFHNFDCSSEPDNAVVG